MTTFRSLTRISSIERLGPDPQVDDKALVFAPFAPELTDPFLALSEDWFSSPGFDWHPHRGLETVTMVVGGVLEHGDNLGHAGALVPGDVQWMTAGRGIVHRELAYRDEHAHTLQLWVNLPAAKKLTDARYQDLVAATMPRLVAPGVVVDVHAGHVGGVAGAARTQIPLQGVVVTLEPNASFRLGVPADHRLFAYVLDGRLRIGGRDLRAGQSGWSDPVGPQRLGAAATTTGSAIPGAAIPGSAIPGAAIPGAAIPGADGSVLELAAPDRDEPAKVMVYSGSPIGEPVALGGPFVMNTGDELAQAYRDFRAGAFGPIPRLARVTA